MPCKGEYRLCFELRNTREVVAREEFLLKDTTPRDKRVVKGKLLYTEGDTQIVVRGRRCEWVLDKVDGTVRNWAVRGRPLLAPGTALVLGQEKPQQTYARKGPGETVYVYLKGAHNLRLTFYPDGAFKVEGAPSCVSFTPAEDTVRYFGRQPGAYKHYWESCTEGLQTETDWLCSGSITAVADTPFTFRIREGQTCRRHTGAWCSPPKRLNETTMNKKVALALASGGPRGFAYIGAIEEPWTAAKRFPPAAAVSAGRWWAASTPPGGRRPSKNGSLRLDPVKVAAPMDFLP